MMGALVLVAGAWLGAVAPGIQSLWTRFRDELLTFSAGLLVGTALLHLLPQSMPLGAQAGYAVLGGFLGVLMLEVFIHGVMPQPGQHTPAASGHEHSHAHSHGHDHGHAASTHEGEDASGEGLHLGHDGVDAHEQHLTISALVGFSLHGVVDGVTLFASQTAGHATGTAFALLAHHVPLAASCCALLRVGGQRGSFWPVVALSSVSPVLGVLLADSTLGQGNLPQYLCGVASGVFLYVATHNLLPVMDIQRGGGRRLIILLVGAGVAAATEIMGG